MIWVWMCGGAVVCFLGYLFWVWCHEDPWAPPDRLYEIDDWR